MAAMGTLTALNVGAAACASERCVYWGPWADPISRQEPQMPPGLLCPHWGPRAAQAGRGGDPPTPPPSQPRLGEQGLRVAPGVADTASVDRRALSLTVRLSRGPEYSRELSSALPEVSVQGGRIVSGQLQHEQRDGRDTGRGAAGCRGGVPEVYPQSTGLEVGERDVRRRGWEDQGSSERTLPPPCCRSRAGRTTRLRKRRREIPSGLRVREQVIPK